MSPNRALGSKEMPMDIQGKLLELREMHEKGLISSAIYEEQQKAILASQLSGAQPNMDPAAAKHVYPVGEKSEFLDPKKNLSVVAKLLLFFSIVLGGIWLIFSLSNADGKNAVSKFASETGIGKQVIPWPDRAAVVANSLVQSNRQSIASAIQGITHPTGNNPSLESFDISKLNSGIIIEFRVAWKGGFLGGDYTTVVAWEIGENNHVGAKITQDSAVTGVEPKNAEALNDYFYTKVYPAFVQGIGR
jgi:hypothetical protein